MKLFDNWSNTLMSEENQTGLPAKIDLLKSRAKLMNINFHPSIGEDKLEEKINARIEEREERDVGEETPVVVDIDVTYRVHNDAANETIPQRNARLRKEASKLQRIRVTCMNPNSKSLEGNIFCVGNSITGTLKKYVPFDNEEGWHVPTIIVKHLMNAKCQIFVSVKTKRGTVQRSKIIKEYAVEILPPLTDDEMKSLATRQAMASGHQED